VAEIGQNRTMKSWKNGTLLFERLLPARPLFGHLIAGDPYEAQLPELAVEYKFIQC
jgi:hypothetical protein